MAKYVYAISLDQEGVTDYGFFLTISRKDYWESAGVVQDDYLDSDLDELIHLFQPKGIHEVMESTYESALPEAELRTFLNNSGLFEFSQGLQSFLDSL